MGGKKRWSGAEVWQNLRFRMATLRDIIGNTITNYQSNGNTNQAAAIALYAILSIIPLFILTLLIISHFFGSDPEIQERLIDGVRQFIPSFTGSLLTQFSQIEGKKDLLGWIGIIVLIWFSAMIFEAIETALNIIFRSKIRRNLFASKALAIAMIPLGWGIGVASVIITYVAAILAHQPLIAEELGLYLPFLHSTISRYLAPYLVMVLFFTVVYKVIPSAKIGWKSALAGSATFSAFMEIAKQFFAWYVANFTRYNVIFGSLEAVVILVIWVFYVSLIFLLCAELISSYKRRDMILLEKALFTLRKGHRKFDEHLFRKFGRLYAKDAFIFQEGDASENLFYILSGRVRLEKTSGQVTRILREMGPGQYFGDMAALTQSPRSISARCAEECHIAVIDGGTLRNLLKENEEVALVILTELSNRLRHSNEAFDKLSWSWIALIATSYFLRNWPLTAGRDPTAELAKVTDRDSGEIQEVLSELGHQGILTIDAGQVTAFHRDKALECLDKQMTVSET